MKNEIFLLTLAAGLIASGASAVGEATNVWAALVPSQWTVNEQTREWSATAVGVTNAGTLAEHDLATGAAMTTQKNAISNGQLAVNTGKGGILTYRPETMTNAPGKTVTIDLSATFVAGTSFSTNGLERLDGSLKTQGAMALRSKADGFVFVGLDYADGGYVWRDLEPKTPLSAPLSNRTEYAVRFVRRYTEVTNVSYFVRDGGTYVPLQYETVDAFALPCDHDYLSLVGFTGTGKIGGLSSLVTLEIPGVGFIVLDPEGNPVPTVFASLDEAIASSAYGSKVTVTEVLAEGVEVTLCPGVSVVFHQNQDVQVLVLKNKGDVDYYTIVNTDGSCALALNEKATPTIEGAEGEEAFVIGTDGKVELNVGNVKPNLFYGLKASGTLEGLKNAEGENWVKATAEGKLTQKLKGDTQGESGFYGVVVTDDPRVMESAEE